ncbi:MAG: ABC transporter related protein [candidate division WS6 bacterium GW2011_GWF2_39_15]|uniref:ABC transporter related protein n=1 Tax=candidate division WS6 bacterium GW2011_GWF2_39_15 TaxID=1619100 RepID=A0A0G0Q5L3_9BACT|nr:MAG: ABC transporter related protein [candidate division WS6 bacterium GW2011_GWF2_39_15]
MNKQTVIKIESLSKSFHVGIQDVPVLRGITLDISSSDFTIIYGPSGCGKSTLLHTILGLEKPTSGSIKFFGVDLYSADLNEDDRSELRKKSIGMVYQQPNWIKSLTVIENVAFPLSLIGVPKVTRLEAAKKELEKLGMISWSNYKPSELSSGQQQKVALARALITDPQIIIADEPTGNLDYESGLELMNVLAELNLVDRKTILMVTHDLEYLRYTKSSIHMLNGEIVKDDNSVMSYKRKYIEK